jgi:hypothetical protein
MSDRKEQAAMSAFSDKWQCVRLGMSKQDVYSIIGRPDNAPDIGHMTVFGYDPEEFEFWNREGKAYQCTFAMSSLRKKKIDGIEDNGEPSSTPPPKSRVQLQETTRVHCSGVHDMEAGFRDLMSSRNRSKRPE